MRESVKHFVEEYMEPRLRENDSEKVPWEQTDLNFLVRRLLDKVGDMTHGFNALMKNEGKDEIDVFETACADIANFAMMSGMRVNQDPKFGKERSFSGYQINDPVYEEGMAAYREDRGMAGNDYPEGSDDYFKWIAGWNHSCLKDLPF